MFGVVVPFSVVKFVISAPKLASSSHERDFRDNLVHCYLQDSIGPGRVSFDLTTSFGSSAANNWLWCFLACHALCTHVLNTHVVHPKCFLMLQHAHANP